jgi:hypothetical protein
MKLNIFCNVTTRRAEATSSGQSLTFPDFIAGDRIKIGVRFLEQIEGVRRERDLKIRSGRLTLGVVDAQPESGTFSVKVGAAPSSAANTTPLLAHTVSAPALAATLNALPVVSSSDLHPATVTFTDGTYHIAFADGSAPGLVVQENLLTPRSFARIRTRDNNGVTAYEMRLMQAPLAQASIFTRELPPAPFIETVQDGGADPSNTSFWPEIQRLTIPPLFRGSFILRYGEFAKSSILNPDINEEELTEGLKQLFTANGYAPTVREEGDGKFLIVFNDENSLGLDLEAMVPQVFTAAEGDVTFDLDLNTREIFDALRSENPLKNCVLEMEADIVDDDEDLLDLNVTARTVTLLHAPVNVRRELTWDGLLAASTVDWLRPPEPKDYIPFTPDQIITGQQHFTAVIGDGFTTVFVLDHQLDTEEIAGVTVRENVSGGALIKTGWSAEITDANTLTIAFDDPPDANEIAVVITAAGPTSVFQTHTHTIPQIVNLQDILDDLGSRVQTLEDLILPGVVAAGPTSSTPAMEIIIPETTAVLHYRGAPVEFGANGLEGLPPRAPFMLPAVHAAGVTTLPTTLPIAQDVGGTVYVNEGSAEVDLPGDGGLRSTFVAPGGFAASDGRLLYAVNRWGSTNSYYPASFERTLFAFAVNDQMLAINRRLQCMFGIEAQLVGATCKAQWVLSIELGVFESESAPAPLGLNLENVAWGAPVVEQAIVLTRLAQTHFFGVRVQRKAAEFLLDSQKYGIWSPHNDAAPTSANFAVRARLTRFDTENRENPRGWVGYRIIGSREINESGSVTTTPAKAIIE